MMAQQLYTDTFKLAEQNQAVESDAYLLDIVSQQTAERLAADSIDSVLVAAELMRLDSIEREIRETDSLRLVNASLVMQKIEKIPAITVEKSWIKDAEEDRNDVLRAIRNMRSPWIR